MRRRRVGGPSLALMLIISAIDMLLCSFTAGLTLFFLATGSKPVRASLSEAALPRAQSEFMTVIVGGGGNGGAVSICGDKRQYVCGAKRVPTDVEGTSNDVAFVLSDPATTTRPLVIGAARRVGSVEWTVSTSAYGKLVSTNIICIVKGPELVMVVQGTRPVRTLAGCQPPEGEVVSGRISIEAKFAQKFFVSSCDDEAVISECQKGDLAAQPQTAWDAEVRFFQETIIIGVEGEDGSGGDMLIRAKVGGFDKPAQIRCKPMQSGQVYSIASVTRTGDIKAIGRCTDW